MKQGQSVTMRPPRSRKGHPVGYPEAYCYPAYAPAAAGRGRASVTAGFGGLVVAVLRACWYVVTLPFRLIFWVIALLGRLTGVILGFVLMVVGMALWAGPFFIIGIPLFIIGLLVTLRCLG
jgi:hypothetical protein